MATKIKPLRKFTTGVPSTSDMEVGELAVNTADKKIYMRDNTSGASSIVEVANASGSAADDITTGNAAVNIATTTGSITIDNQANDQDIIFKGTDNNVDITALTLDMSDSGRAIFNKSATFGDSITINGDGTKSLVIGDEALSADSNYVGMKTTAMTGTADYMILSGVQDANNPDSTFISAKSGSNVFIRGGGNNVSHQIEVGASLAKAYGIFEVGTRIELGHASDTTLERSAAGTVQIEGNTILTTGNADTPADVSSSAEVDHVLVNDGGVLKKAIVDNLGVTASSLAANDLTAGNAAVNLTTTSGNITIDAQGSDTDIIFKGTDGSTDVTFLTFDGSADTALFETATTTFQPGGAPFAAQITNTSVGLLRDVFLQQPAGGSDVRLIFKKSGANQLILDHTSPASGNQTITLPGVTGTVLTTGNADTPTTVSSSAEVDHVLVNDGGVLKKAIVSNLGVSGSITSDAQNNTSGGTDALDSMTSGQASNNTAFGKDALTTNTTADSNTAFGAFALDAATIGGSNNAFGHNALTSLTEGQANSAFGAVALDSLTTGNNNSAFGQGAGDGLTTGGNNITVGHLTMGRHSESDDNVAIGFMSMYGTFVSGGVISNKNVAIGRESLYNMNSGANQNVGIGYRSSYNLSTGDDNVTIGFESAHGLTTGGQNVTIGSESAHGLTTGGQNVFIGPKAAKGDGSNAVTGSSNVAIGEMALEKLQAASSLVAVGRLAMRNSHSADNSVAIGTMALEDGTDYSYAVAVGTQALTNLTTGSYNTGVGHSVGGNITDETRNSLFGYEAGYNIKGSNNTAIGNQALYYSTTDQTGANNTGLGYRAGFVIQGGDQNTFVGYQSGQAMTTGNNNVILGGYDGNSGGVDLRTSDNNVVLSDGAGNIRARFDSNSDLFLGGDVDILTSTGGTLTLQNSSTAISANDVLGKIEFQAPNESTGGVADDVTAAIEVIASGDMSSNIKAFTDFIFKGSTSTSINQEIVRINGDGGISMKGNLSHSGSGNFSIENVNGNTNLSSSNNQAKVQGNDVLLNSFTSMQITAQSGNITLDASGSNTDIIFKGTDGSFDITALTLDMSDAGTAIFNKNITLDSDSSVIKFGDDQDVTLTHVHNTGLLLNSTSQLQFGDSGTYIHQSADGVLDLVADTELELNGGIVDINSTGGNVDITAVGGTVTLTGDTGNITIENNASDGDIIFKGTDNTSDITALTLDMSELGKALFNDDIQIGTSGHYLTIDRGNTTITAFGNPLTLNSAGGVQIQRSGSTKITTTTTGADITGVLTTDGIITDGTISSDATINKYGSSSAPITFTVTVVAQTTAHPYYNDGSSNKYAIDGAPGAALTLHGADDDTSNSEYVYRFDQSDSSNISHPLRFYLDAAKNTAYTTGVTTVGTPGYGTAYTQIAVTKSTPKTLYYQCQQHNYMGNYVTVANSTNFTSDITVTGRIITDDTTEATSTTDGSLQTDGGLSVAKDIVAGDDIKLLSDASVIHFGTNQEIKLTHVHDTGLKIQSAVGSPTLQLHDSNESVSSDGTNLILTSGGKDFKIPTSDGGNGTFLQTDGSGNLSFAAAGGHAFKTIAVTGTSGQSDVVADAADDTLTLVAGSNMTITTNASGDEITFASSGGGSGSTVAADDITLGNAPITIANSTGDITIDTGDSGGAIIFRGTTNAGVDVELARFTSSGVANFSLPIQTNGNITSASPGGDLTLQHDGAKARFGTNAEIQLTHVHNVGLLLTETGGGQPTLQFVDSNESISSDGTNLILTSGGTDFKMPTSDGTGGHFLKTDGSGNLSFAAASGGGGGSGISTGKSIAMAMVFG